MDLQGKTFVNMMDTCAYIGCDSGRHRGDRLFSIPKEENIRKEWISRIGNPALNCYTSSTLSRLGICVKHFSREMFNRDPILYRKRRRILKRDALPIPSKIRSRNKKEAVTERQIVVITEEEDNDIEKDMSGNETEVVINGQRVMITEEEDNDIARNMSGNGTELVINGQRVTITEEEDNDIEKNMSGNETEVVINGQRVMITEEEDNDTEKDTSRNETEVVINGQRVMITEEEDNDTDKDRSRNETEVVINGQRVMITEEADDDIEKDMSGNETEIVIKRQRVMITEQEDRLLSSHLMSIKKEGIGENGKENDQEMVQEETEEEWYYHYQDSSEEEVEQEETRLHVTKPMITYGRMSLSVTDDKDDSMEWIRIDPQTSSESQIENPITKTIFEMRLESENAYLRKENRDLKKQVKFVKDKLRKVKAARNHFYEKSRKVETVDEFLNRHKCTNNVARTLVKLQLKDENVAYTNDERDLATMMYYNSPSAYSKLRKSGCHLPGESTIRRKTDP